MAEQKIQFNIGAVFSGEGFKQAQKSVSSMNNDVKKGIGAMNQIAGALGGMDASAAKAMGAMTGLLNSLVSLNATAIITQGAMFVLSQWIEKVNKEVEETKKRADEFKAAVDKAFKDTLAESMSGLQGELKHIIDDFERITKQATAMNAALSGLKGSVATGGIINLEIEKLNAALDAHSDAERAASDAAYDLKIAEAKAAASEEAWNDKLNAVYDEMAANRERIARFDDAIAKVQQKRAQFEETAQRLRQNNQDKAQLVEAEIERLRQQEAKLIADHNAALENSKLLDVKEKTVRQDAANATAQMTLAINRAIGQIDKVADEQEKLAAAEKQKREEEEAKKREEAKRAEAEKLNGEHRDALNFANAASQEVAKAEKKLADAQANYNKEFGYNKMADEILNHKLGKGELAAPINVKGETKQAILNHNVEEAIKNGEVRSVKDLEKMTRQQVKDINKMEREQLFQLEQEQQKYEKLKARPERTLSKADKDWMKNFEKIKQAQEDKKRQEQQAKKELEEARKREKEGWDNVKKIKTKLEKLGLK